MYVRYSFEVKTKRRAKNFISIVFSVKFCVRWYKHFDDIYIEAGLGVDFGGWWVVDILSRPRVGSIFNVSRHFSYPRDAKFCDEYASKGLVLITSLWEEED